MSTSSSSTSESLKPTSPTPAKHDRLELAWRRGLTPPPYITVPEWADRYRRKAAGAGSTTGKWRTGDVEIARGPMLAVTEPGTAIITVMVCTQLMKTALIENAFGFFAHLDPSPMLMLQPKEDAAEQFSKERITPLIKATPVLRDLVGTRKTRNSDETIRYKSFPGGFLAIEGAGSPDNVARRPIKRVFCDEIDKYVPTREGDAVGLAEERMRKQKNRDGVRTANITPRYLVVGPDKENEALQFLTVTTPARASDAVPSWMQTLELIVEPRIVGNAWYLFAEPSRAAVVQVAYLAGADRLYTDSRIGWDVDGIQYKGRIDFNAKALGYAGGYKNPGN